MLLRIKKNNTDRWRTNKKNVFSFTTIFHPAHKKRTENQKKKRVHSHTQHHVVFRQQKNEEKCFHLCHPLRPIKKNPEHLAKLHLGAPMESKSIPASSATAPPSALTAAVSIHAETVAEVTYAHMAAANRSASHAVVVPSANMGESDRYARTAAEHASASMADLSQNAEIAMGRQSVSTIAPNTYARNAMKQCYANTAVSGLIAGTATEHWNVSMDAINIHAGTAEAAESVNMVATSRSVRAVAAAHIASTAH